jgi:hypothetical protein
MLDAMGHALCANDVSEEGIPAYTFLKDRRGLYTPMRAKSLGDKRETPRFHRVPPPSRNPMSNPYLMPTPLRALLQLLRQVPLRLFNRGTTMW